MKIKRKRKRGLLNKLHINKRLLNRVIVVLSAIVLVTTVVVTASTISRRNAIPVINEPDKSSSGLSESSDISNPQSESSDDNSTSIPEGSTSSISDLPASGEATGYEALYPDMVVEKSEFVERTEGDKVVYMTFDDGPCDSTGRLLDVLDDLDIKVTFFLTAQFEDEQQIISDIKDMHDRGHVVAVHSYTHDYKDIYSSVENFLADYKKMDDLILEATGERSKIFRFPGGSNTKKNSGIRDELIAEMERRGFIFHDWSAHNGDSEGYNMDRQIERAVRECTAKEKSVLLMHNTPGKDMVIDSLPTIVAKLKEQGYRFDVIDETVRPYQFSPSSLNK